MNEWEININEVHLSVVGVFGSGIEGASVVWDLARE